VSGPLDRLDGSQYGDPEDHRPAHVAPLCDSCEEREAVEERDLGDETVALCGRCIIEEPHGRRGQK